MTRIGVDVGGTFTDLVALTGAGIVTAKVPSTPKDQSEGVMACIARSGIDPAGVAAFAHGMTVATNTLLERAGARTALVTTHGFLDLIEIGRQNRPSLYDLQRSPPPPLIPRHLRFAVRERMGPEGEIMALSDQEVDRLVVQLSAAGVEAVAVCLLFSFIHPDHERRIAAAIRESMPEVRVSVSHEVLPEFREYERFSTTVADAYVAPKMRDYLSRLSDRASEAGLPEPLVMQSSGGVIDIASAARHAVTTLLSGPAGGVVGAAYVAAASGYRDVLTFDMGGTSTDVAAVRGGRAEVGTESVIAGVSVKAPMVDIHTVGAGGGSVAWVDDGGALRVGPRSAGAEPGPAAYGRGGEDATVTDADLFLGYLVDGARLGGDVVLDRERAREALGHIGKRVGMDELETAAGIVELANVEMTRALRVVSIQRGFDPRDFALVSFGGAGPMHACAVAEQLGMQTVVVPRASGVLSALGLAISDVRRDYVTAFHVLSSECEEQVLEHAFEALERRALREVPGAQMRRGADLRYAGQAFELTVDADDASQLRARFDEEHERRYGYCMTDEVVEIVNLRVVATLAVDKPALRETSSGRPGRAGRPAYFDGKWIEVPVHRRDALGVDVDVTGPCIVEFAECTCLLRPSWQGRVDATGNLILKART